MFGKLNRTVVQHLFQAKCSVVHPGKLWNPDTTWDIPLFNICLVSFLSYYTVVLNNDAPNWIMIAIFVDAQLLFNWIQFLRYQSIIRPSKKNFPGKKGTF